MNFSIKFSATKALSIISAVNNNKGTAIKTGLENIASTSGAKLVKTFPYMPPETSETAANNAAVPNKLKAIELPA